MTRPPRATPLMFGSINGKPQSPGAGAVEREPWRPKIQLIDGGSSVTPKSPLGVAGPPCAAPDSAEFLFLGSLAVNSKTLSRANHGASPGINMPATIIPHTTVAMTIMRRVIFIAHKSFFTPLPQYFTGERGRRSARRRQRAPRFLSRERFSTPGQGPGRSGQ